MKTFVIFPALCVFISAWTLLIKEVSVRPMKKVMWTTLATVVFAGMMVMFSNEVFLFLYYSNFLSVLIIVPCLTYLVNRALPTISGKMFWLRLLGLGFASSILTVAVFVVAMFFSFAYNPMEKTPKQYLKITTSSSDGKE